MPNMDDILNIPGLKVVGPRNKLPLEIDVELTLPIACPKCHARDYRKKCCYMRRIRHENFGKRSVYLWLKLWKYICKRCFRFFRSPIPGVRKWQRATDAFKFQVCETHQMGISQKKLTDRWFLSCSTIERRL